MPRADYRSTTIRSDIYQLAEKQAESEELTVSEIITKAVKRYIQRETEFLEDIKKIMKTYEQATNSDV